MSPAREVIKKCGGPKETAALAAVSINYVYRWVTGVESGGLGGRVPERARRRLLAAASDGKVDLKPDDFEEGWSAQ